VSADLEQIRWWSWRRQRLDRSCRGIDDCLRSIVGVYGANPHGALSLLARVPRVMPGMVDGAIESRTALRLPAMGRALWLLHAETAHLAFRAVDQLKLVKPLVQRQISEDEYARLEHEILLAAGFPKTADEIREAIKNPPEKLGPVLHALAAEGKLLYLNEKAPSKGFTYAATRVWLGHDLPDADPAEALVWLAGDYLKAFGPATVEDFTHWVGVERADAESALRAHDPEDIGDGLLMWPSDRKAFEGTRPVANRVNLLPALDAYTLGYAPASRARFADPELLPYLYDKNGVNSTSVILIEGTVAGLWDFVLGDRKIKIRIGLFESPTPRALESIESEAGLVAGYFNAREVDIVRVRVRSPIADRGPKAYLKPLADQESAARPKPAPPKPAVVAKPIAKPAAKPPVKPAVKPAPKPVPPARVAKRTKP
jgi:Winged helix DNA-binding domain